MKILWSRGRLPRILLDVLATIHPAAADDAGDFHRSICLALRRAKFFVQFEYPMPYWDRAGRIDLHAHRRDTGNLWLELDRRNPRRKSIVKLTNAIARFCGCAAVVCRVPPKG